MDGIRQFLGGVQYALQPSEAAVRSSSSLSRAVGVRCSLSRMNAVRIASMLSRNLCLRLNAIFLYIKDDSPRQLRVEQVVFGRQGEIVVREVID